MTNGGISRRELLRLAAAGGGALGLAALLGACDSNKGGGGSASATAPPGSLQALQANAVQLSLLGAQSQLQVGSSLFTFGLSTPDNRLVAGGTPQVWAATDDTSTALGPFPTRWFELTAYKTTKDRSPRSELTGFYGAEVELPKTGDWMVAASLELDGSRAVGRGAVPVVDNAPAAVGSKARAVHTPVATTVAGRRKICTRDPVPCPLHSVSLDDALRAGRPTVVSFATPLLCTSRMCGPVVDEQMVAAAKLGRRASFIHVEVYPDRNPDKPAPAMAAYGFTTEPWVLVVDRDGVIRARFEGPVTSTQIEAAVRPLLA
jgi:hypothetical protein